MNWIKKNSLYLAWLIALLSMAGSLYFSEVLDYPPCVLCWYQRIAMYPLVFILAIGILNKDKNVHRYALPLVLVGFAISIYHNLLYYNILPESAAPCTLGISCTTKFIEWFGFITIPLLSLGGFVASLGLLLIHKKYNK